MLRGVVERDQDISGVSGVGKVAEFAIAVDGRIVIFWPDGHSYFSSLQDAIKVHGHNGKTRFVFLDEEESNILHCNVCHDIWNNLQEQSIGGCVNHNYGCPGCLANYSKGE